MTKFIKLKDVMGVTALARSTIYKFIAEGTFPKQISLGGNCVAWIEEEVLDWMSAKIEQRDSQSAV